MELALIGFTTVTILSIYLSARRVMQGAKVRDY
jgi:hypothetical protein